jgi:uncharacterized cupin superfamily protein
MANLNDPLETSPDGLSVARLGERAGTEQIGLSLYELQPGDGMVFHYHLSREEMIVVLEGTVELRTGRGTEQLREGDVVAFPRGERGAHGYRNVSDEPARVLMIAETTAPNISVYPDTNEIGVFDSGKRSRRRFGARFRVEDAVADYGGTSKAEIVPPAPGPRQSG